MARQPNFKSAPDAVMSIGRTCASFIRDANSMLRKNVELVKYHAAISKDPEEKRLLEEYLHDPSVNSAAEPFQEEKLETKVLSERDKLFARVTRVLKDASEQELDLILKIAKVSKKPQAPIPEKPPKEKSAAAPAALAKVG
ncbi:MAG: hypothetical protein M3Y08_18820 [Fibrobacterota bacterium]|nr:hypothetical protein [Fibrobacterota bacterium]